MLGYFKSIISLDDYYSSIQRAFINLFGRTQMLHYPLHEKDGQTLLEGQQYLSSYCIQKLGSLENKIVVDIGCGNGVQTLYILKQFKPLQLIGIELNSENIKVALAAVSDNDTGIVSFIQDNAEILKKIKSNSTDVVICIESAFHYQDKQAFLNQVKRILKANGTFLIADLTLKPRKSVNIWERKVKFNIWNESQYLKGFTQADLQVVLKEDLTPKVIKAFKDNENWFNGPRRAGRVSWHFSMLFANSISKLYEYQLERRHNYTLYVGHLANQHLE